MPVMDTIDKRDTEDMRRFRSVQWVDPKGGPTYTVRGAMKALGFSSEKSIYLYTNRKLENGGLPGYIPAKDGNGWIRKSNAVNGVEIMFYKSDLDAWREAHPAMPNPTPKTIRYTEQEAHYVLDMAKTVELPDGSIYRSHLNRKLTQIDQVRVHFYDGRPDMTGWLILSSPGLATLYVTRHNQIDIVLDSVDIAIQKSGRAMWNVRAYPKLKRILDDAAIPIAPLPQTKRKEDVG